MICRAAGKALDLSIDHRAPPRVPLAPVSEPQFLPAVTRKKADLSFEQALSELEALVESLEKGELSLEQSLESFERGVTLTRNCQRALQDAEQKVRILSGESKDAQLEPFEREE